MNEKTKKPSSAAKQAGQSSSASDRTKLATLLAESVAERDLLKRVIDAIPDTGLTIRDRDYRLTFQSEITVRLYGKRLGEKCYSVFEGRDDVCEGCPAALAFEDGQPHTSVREVVMPSGDMAFWENVASPIWDADGNVVSCLELSTDITQRKQAEDALLESEKRYRTEFENAPQGILVADIETRQIRHANPTICHMLGYSEDELTQKKVQDIHPRDALEHVISEFEAQARGEKTLAADIPCLHKDGTTIYADINTAKVILDGRECNIGFVTDITERKRLEESLAKVTEEERERLRRDLHDSISQQLTGLRLLAASLRRELLGTHPGAADHAFNIEQVAGDALESVQQIAKGLEPLSKEPGALTTALAELASRARHLHGVQCRFVSRKPVLIHNPDTATHLFLIAQEAVSNAVKHAKPGKITISLSQRNNTVTLTITDDGRGLSGKTRHNGSGMGLHIMQSRATLIGASFDVQAGKAGGTVVTCSRKKKTPKEQEGRR